MTIRPQGVILMGNRPPGESPPWGITPLGNHPPGESPPGESSPGESPPWGIVPLGNHPLGNRPPAQFNSNCYWKFRVTPNDWPSQRPNVLPNPLRKPPRQAPRSPGTFRVREWRGRGELIAFGQHFFENTFFILLTLHKQPHQTLSSKETEKEK